MVEPYRKDWLNLMYQAGNQAKEEIRRQVEQGCQGAIDRATELDALVAQAASGYRAAHDTSDLEQAYAKSEEIEQIAWDMKQRPDEW